MAMDETLFVQSINPIDIGGVRDPGVQALILLAASLGWNVLKKHNTPAVLTARDGTQKRLPTDGSCKMSVFQSALSTIMVHTSPEIMPTIELMDRIIAEAKPSTDHARRLRLAVGEDPATHRQRVANDKVAQRREEEHLTQHIEVPDPRPGDDTSAIREGLEMPHTPPFDGEEHGECISRKPFMAHYSGSGSSSKHPGYLYESKTSLERIWEDGYIDYECIVCGLAKGSPCGVASHRQVHTKAGEVELDMRYMTEEYRAKHRDSRKKHKQAEAVEFVDELPVEHLEEQEQQLVEAEDDYAPKMLSQIIELLLPDILAASDKVIAALTEERDEALKRLAEVEAEFDALVDLLTSRKKDRT